MAKNQNQIKANIKRIFVQCVALLLVIYVLAGISILQTYFGNETVGIPPSHHFSEHHHDFAENENSSEANQNIIKQSHNDGDSHEGFHSHCFFGSSAEVEASFFAINSTVIQIIEVKNQLTSRENKRPNSEHKNLFRPPQIA